MVCFLFFFFASGFNLRSLFQHMFPCVNFQLFSTSIVAYSFSLLSLFVCLLSTSLLSSFCPISKSSYEPSLLSVKGNAVSFNRSWISSHGFHLPIFFFFFPASSVCSQTKINPGSCFHFQLLENLLELFFPLLTLNLLQPLLESFQLCPSHSKQSPWSAISPATEHFGPHPPLLDGSTSYIFQIRISLLFSPLSFTNDAKKAAVGFCSLVLPLPSLLLPSWCQRCGLHKISISLLNTGEIYCLAFFPRTRHEAWCNIIQIPVRTEMKLHRPRGKEIGRGWVEKKELDGREDCRRWE